MNPMAALLIIVAIGAAFMLLVFVIDRRTQIHTVRHRDLRLAQQALAQIEEEADKYDEIDSILAMRVKDIIRQHRKEQRILG